MKKLSILFLEDELMDAALIKKVLERSGMNFDATIVSNKTDYLHAIKASSFDAILADNSVPQFDANEAMQLTRENNVRTPFILVTGTVSEEFAVAIMKAGATDYILKDRLQRLPGAVMSAISKHSLEMLQQKNIDDLIKNEAIMKKSEQLAHFGSWESDATTNLVRWSDETYRILGYQPGEMTPSMERFFVKIHPEDVDAVKLMMQQTVDHVNMLKFKCRIVNNDGSVKNLDNEIFVTRDMQGKLTRLNGLARDITETSTAMEQLHKSDANLRTIFDHADTGYVLLDTAWNIVSFNQPACQFSLEQLEKVFEKGNNVLDSIQASKHSMLEANLKNALKGTSTRYELSYSQEDGSEKWYSINCAPVLGNTNTVLGVIISERDITRKKLLELQEKKITADLIQRNSDLEQFAYIVSHNLRGPVATILGISELVSDKNLHEEEKNYFMDGLISSVKKLDEVIIDLNHIIHAKTTINEKREWVSFSQLVADVSASLQFIANDDSLNIRHDFAEAEGMETIKSYMHSIFYNLVSNSIKYRQPTGPLAIEVSSRKTQGKLELVFKDNGMGIDLKKKGDQLFGLYKRFHTTLAEGKGMGLFMVKTQVETLGGKISVDSEVSVGTEFIIEFECNN